MNAIDRRTALIAGIASASLVSNTTGFAQQADATSAEAKLRQLGIELPKVPTPVANYVPAARLGNLIFLPGRGRNLAIRLTWSPVTLTVRTTPSLSLMARTL